MRLIGVDFGIYSSEDFASEAHTTETIPGNETMTSPGGGFSLIDPLEFIIPKAVASDLLAGKVNVYVVLNPKYENASGTKYEHRYNEEIRFKNNQSRFLADPKPFKCFTQIVTPPAIQRH